ncbi:MAG: hypothetical protein CL870_03515 [Cytophagia bacterium]|jgi:hypothetical protein|nr:hypothetical protein [Cytophagia bacterium]
MKQGYFLLILAFIMYLIGHILWSVSLLNNISFNELNEIWLINIPFGLFSILGLIGVLKLYRKS